jgi:large subunit ribosomal protein L22
MAQAKKKDESKAEAKAIVNRLRISPIKLGYVAGLIRGMKVEQALTQLAFSNKRIARDVRKAVQSAVANAENNFNMNVDDLIVSEAWVGKSLVMKRMHTRARGRSARILKPFSNLTIILREKGE